MNTQLEQAEREILRLVIEGADLVSILTRTCLQLEHFLPGAKCSILLVDPTGSCLLPGAAPNLPATYTEALRGLPIGPDVGCCGTAVATGRTVVTTSIAADPKWEKFKHLASRCHLASCWSIPLFDMRQKPLGTFAVYHSEPHDPPPDELLVARELSSVVSVAIAWQSDRDALMQSRSEAADANQAKSFFLAQMSHELRTPLNAILGFSDAMRASMFGPLGSARYREYAEHIHQSGVLLLTMVDGLLDLSRLESGQLEARSEQFEVETLVKECVATFMAPNSVPAPAIEYEGSEIGIEIIYDRASLARAVINLLSNAVRHTDETGKIVIHWRRSPEGLSILFKDNGSGISPETLAQLGKPFVRHRPKGAGPPVGTGLGIYICRSIIELHGGNLKIASEPGLGTEVTLHIPPERVVPARLS